VSTSIATEFSRLTTLPHLLDYNHGTSCQKLSCFTSNSTNNLMSTASMNISLPDSLKKYVKERVDEERYGTQSDYVRSLIREDQKRHDENKLEQMLLDGLKSGPGIRMNPKEWKKLWAEVDAQVINNKRST
jgi:antitoxin ParD1/3/4